MNKQNFDRFRLILLAFYHNEKNRINSLKSNTFNSHNYSD